MSHFTGAFWTSRGIDPKMAAARPYIPWTIEHIEPVTHAYKNLNKSQRAYMTRLAHQSDGWVITRHAIPGESHIYAEIRPDKKVVTGPPVRHWHGSGEPPEKAYEPGTKILTRGTVAWGHHCRRVEEDKAEEDTSHGAREDVHEHIDAAKYVFPPSPTRDEPWPHDHERGYSAEYYKRYPEALKRHLENWHSDPDIIDWNADGTHTHYRRVKDHGNNLARRIDVHPYAWPLIEKHERVFFVIEGCLKADSILSAGEAVFSVPSVSLWHAPELEWFAKRYLRDKRVIVVPDADWVDNDAVISQARFAQRFLTDLGVPTFVAAPPLGADRTVVHKGVDDYLGAGGGKLDDLMVMERTVSPNLVACARRVRPFYRSDAIGTDVKMLKSLSHHADEDGAVGVPLLSLAKIMGVNRQTVANSVKRLEAHGWITVEGDLATRKNYWSKNLEWEDMPRIIIDPSLRGTNEVWPLSELQGKLSIPNVKFA
jgi:hypothetical protein